MTCTEAAFGGFFLAGLFFVAFTLIYVLAKD